MHMQSLVPQKLQKARLLWNYNLSSTGSENDNASHHDNKNEEWKTNSVPIASNLTPSSQRSRVACQNLRQENDITMVKKPCFSTIREITEHGNYDKDIITLIQQETGLLTSKPPMKRVPRCSTSNKKRSLPDNTVHLEACTKIPSVRRNA